VGSAGTTAAFVVSSRFDLLYNLVLEVDFLDLSLGMMKLRRVCWGTERVTLVEVRWTATVDALPLMVDFLAGRLCKPQFQRVLVIPVPLSGHVRADSPKSAINTHRGAPLGGPL
jgi:hypothetical protein